MPQGSTAKPEQIERPEFHPQAICLKSPLHALQSQKKALYDFLSRLDRLDRRNEKRLDSKETVAMTDRPHDHFMLLDGGRGEGKTSTFLTLYSLLHGNQKEEATLRSQWGDGGPLTADNLEKLAANTWVLMIHPSQLGIGECLMERLLACMQISLQQRQQASISGGPIHRHGRGGAEVNDPLLASKLDELLKRLRDYIYPSWAFHAEHQSEVMARDASDWRDYTQMRFEQASDTATLNEEWRHWLESCLSVLGKHQLLVMVDDADVPPLHVDDTLQAMRLYLDHPQVAVVLAAQLKAIHSQLMPVFYHELARLGSHPQGLPDEHSRAMYWGWAQEEVSQFVLKVLPTLQRQRLELTQRDLESADVGQDLQELMRQVFAGAQRPRTPVQRLIHRLDLRRTRGELRELVDGTRELLNLLSLLWAALKSQPPTEVDDDSKVSALLSQLARSLPSWVFLRDATEGSSSSEFAWERLDTDTWVAALQQGMGSAITRRQRAIYKFLVPTMPEQQRSKLMKGYYALQAAPDLWLRLANEAESILGPLKRSELTNRSSPWLHPTNVQDVLQVMDLVTLRRFTARQWLTANAASLVTLRAQQRAWRTTNWARVCRIALLILDGQQGKLLTWPAYRDLTSGDWRLGSEAQWRSSRSLAAFTLWQLWQASGDKALQGSAPDDLDEFRTRRWTDEELRPFTQFLVNYLEADVVRGLLRDAMRYTLTSALTVHAWNLDDAGEDGAELNDWAPTGELPLFDEKRAMQVAQAMVAAWGMLSALPKKSRGASYPHSNVGEWSPIECARQFLRATVRPLTQLLKLDISSVPMEARSWLQERLKGLDKAVHTPEVVERQRQDLLRLLDELQTAGTPWEKLDNLGRMQRLNPLQVWPEQGPATTDGGGQG